MISGVFVLGAVGKKENSKKKTTIPATFEFLQLTKEYHIAYYKAIMIHDRSSWETQHTDTLIDVHIPLVLLLLVCPFLFDVFLFCPSVCAFRQNKKTCSKQNGLFGSGMLMTRRSRFGISGDGRITKSHKGRSR